MVLGKNFSTQHGANAGFSFLEAIVAVTIVGVVLLPIMSLINQSISQLRMVADANRQSMAMESSIAAMGSVNPLVEPDGTMDLGNFSLSWASETLVAPNTERRPGTGLAGFSTGFYSLRVTTYLDNGDEWFSFDTRKVGYRTNTISNPFGAPNSR